MEGDPCSPKYVEGAMKRLGHDVRRVDVGDAGEAPELNDVVVLSDVPAEDVDAPFATKVVDAVRGGVGLVVVGGWMSFGRGGYADSTIASLLPVSLQEGDDRVTRPSGAFPRALREHAILEGLPLDRPPVLTGWNRLEPRSGATTVLEAVAVASVGADAASLAADGDALLVVGTEASGRVAAFASDLAPHWSGGLTDWGDEDALVDVGEGEQVGSAYLRFVDNLLRWTAGERVRSPSQGARASR